MLTNEILDQCFLVLGSAVDADAAVEEITKIFREKEIQTSDPFGYLLQNASTFFEQHGANEEQERLAKLIEVLNSQIREIDDKIKELRKIGDTKQIEDSNLQRQDLVKEKTKLNSQDDEEEHGKKQKFDIYKKDAQKTRNEAVANFLGLKDSKKYFNQERSQSLLALMLSNSMFWTPQVTLAAIEASENVKGKIKTKERRVEGGKFVEVESELGYVEYLLSQRSFGKDTPHVKDIALSLLRKGCDFDATSNINWSNLLHSRAVESGLLVALCSYFVKEQNNFAVFFNLIERLDEKANSLISSNVSRFSAAASRGVGTAAPNPAAEFEGVAKAVVDECIKNKKLWDEAGKTSLPRFVLARKNGEQSGKGCEFSKRVWTYI